MIAPMKKFTFLIYHKQYQDFLTKLQELGVVHIIEQKKETNLEIKELNLKINRFTKAIKFLKSFNPEKKEKPDITNGFQVLENLEELQKQHERLQQKLNLLKKEIKNLEPWGDFNPEVIKKLHEKNIYLKLFITSEKKFNPEWKEKYNIEIINQVGNTIYFTVICAKDEKLDIQAEEIKFPERPLSELEQEKQHLEEEIELINKQFQEYAEKYISLLEKNKNELIEKLDFNIAVLNTEKEADEKVMVLQGWVPEEKKENLIKFLNDFAVVYLEEDPQKDDKVPILLKNNKFAKLFEPIAKMFSLPSYMELDLTPFFAPFFTLFFGFCIGDAGYGIILLLATTYFKTKAKPNLKPVLTLAQILGLSTIIIGTLVGTVFGYQLVNIESLKQYILIPDQNQLFNISLILGVIQILFGMVIKVINLTIQYGFKYSISTIGWIIMVISILGISLGFMKPIANITIWVGVGLILLFNDPGKNIFIQIGKGLWDLYNITGFVGDVLSYVRLFALGISSAILGLVINQLGRQFLSIPIIGPIIFIVFLTVGHAGNLMLASLGAFVHPLRLTFVEFYKNAGFQGGGKEYKPFSLKK